MTANKVKVFLDANVVISAGKPPGNPQLARVFDLIKTRRITVLTTDLTTSEIARRHAKNDFDKVKDICRPDFCETLNEVLGTQIRNIKEDKLRETLIEKYKSSVGEMFNDKMRVKTLSLNKVMPDAVFSDYSHRKGFFAESQKKDQFPDAFVFECLKQEASEEEPVIIVSNDKDFVQPVANQQHISLVNTLPELFDALGLKIEDPDIEEFLEHKDAEISAMVEKDLPGWTLQGDIEDSEIYDVGVNDIELQEIIAFKSAEEGQPILIVGSLKVIGTASFSHPDWETAFWDSEDKVAIPHDTVDGHAEIEFSVDVSLSVEVNENGTPVEIQELSIQDVCDYDIVLNSAFEY